MPTAGFPMTTQESGFTSFLFSPCLGEPWRRRHAWDSPYLTYNILSSCTMPEPPFTTMSSRLYCSPQTLGNVHANHPCSLLKRELGCRRSGQAPREAGALAIVPWRVRDAPPLPWLLASDLGPPPSTWYPCRNQGEAPKRPQPSPSVSLIL